MKCPKCGGKMRWNCGDYVCIGKNPKTDYDYENGCNYWENDGESNGAGWAKKEAEKRGQKFVPFNSENPGPSGDGMYLHFVPSEKGDKKNG